MMLQRLKLGIFVFALCAIVACKDEEKKTTPTSAQTESTAGDESIKVNPAHGLPGHRCDLPVGAPLNGNTARSSNTTTSNQTQSTTISPIRVDQTPDVNPPHGQPGHDCSVPVGAKLEN